MRSFYYVKYEDAQGVTKLNVPVPAMNQEDADRFSAPWIEYNGHTYYKIQKEINNGS